MKKRAKTKSRSLAVRHERTMLARLDPGDILESPDVTPKQAGVPRLPKGTIEQKPPPAQEDATVAPWPTTDRWPVILGSKITLSYIASVFRTCLTGYRREFCDMLDELLERDPHMYAVMAQRVHAVSGGELQIVAAECEEKDEERAEEIRAYVERCFERIPDRQQALSLLQWGGLYYGAGALEITWGQDEGGFYPARLHWIHSRRLNYPDPGSWSVRIWDQGFVHGYGTQGYGNPGENPTSEFFGIKAEQLPGKFITHTPAVRGNYPTRDGLGRQVAIWSAIKLMAARGAGQYIERFGKPWVIAKYKTSEKENEHRTADRDDIEKADAAARALGVGSMSSATLPDSVDIDIFGPAANSPGRQLFHKQLIDLCNSEISKAVLGQTDTTEPSANGSRGAVEVRKQGTQELYRYDASCLADTLQSDVVYWIVSLNYPGEEHLAPRVKIHAAEEPDLNAILDRACKMAEYGAPVDLDALAEEIGVPMAPKPDPQDVLDAQIEADNLADQQAELDHNAAQDMAKQQHAQAVEAHKTNDAGMQKAAKEAGVAHVPQAAPVAPIDKPFVKPLRPVRKLPKDTTRTLLYLSPMKPYELQDLKKLQNGEELAPPPKPMLPTAEVAGAPPAAGGSSGAQAMPKLPGPPIPPKTPPGAAPPTKGP